MKETPYAFPAPIADPMIRALLEGRKSQIRVPVKRQPIEHHWKFFEDYKLSQSVLKCQDLRRGGTTLFVQWTHQTSRAFDKDQNSEHSPLGAPGDRVWFREAYAEVGNLDPGILIYRADFPRCVPSGLENIPPVNKVRWRSSRTMPRWASRISREIVSARVERVREISADDACDDLVNICEIPGIGSDHSILKAYAETWNRAHGPGAFEKNPLVWVYDFKEVE